MKICNPKVTSNTTYVQIIGVFELDTISNVAIAFKAPQSVAVNGNNALNRFASAHKCADNCIIYL